MVVHRWIHAAGVAVLSCVAASCGPAPAGSGAQIAVPPSAPSRPPALPDASFEAQPSEWKLGPTATIVATATPSGSKALRVELDHGLGSLDVTRSAYLTDIELGRDYDLSFRYRYEGCKSAVFTIAAGAYEKKLQLDGTEPKWLEGHIVVSFEKKPAWIDVTAGRLGSADRYAGPEYDDNVLWLDDFVITPR